MVNSKVVKQYSIVVPTKNGGELFARALETLMSQRMWPEIELIVVDSGSTDGTLETARQAGATVVEIQPEEFNHGSTRDYGISLANGEIVILMVQDAVPNDTNMIDGILLPFDDPRVAGVYARQIPQHDADLLTKRKLNNWLTARRDREVRCLVSIKQYEALSPIDKYYFCNFDNVCSAIRKSVWHEHKFGRVSFGEDIDWAERVLKAGYCVAYEPSAAVIHSHDRSIFYEYKRTYICHRKLYSQFGLMLVPTLRDVLIAWFGGTSQDFSYIFSEELSLSAKCKLFMKSAALNLLSTYAQYRAAQDEVAGRSHSIVGV